ISLNPSISTIQLNTVKPMPSFPCRRESRPWDNSNIQRLAEALEILDSHFRGNDGMQVRGNDGILGFCFWFSVFVGMTECRFVGMTGF
ncbi:TPA: hypothetical protein ACJJNZ_001637, partial [Neisseria meningitidis]